MTETINLNRRKILRYAGIGTLAATTIPGLLIAENGIGRQASINFHADVEIELTARKSDVSMLPGPATNVWQYFAKLSKGPKGSLETIPGSFLGPILRLRKGQKVRISFHNELPAETIVHWHGLHVPADMDGHPMYAIQQGQTFVYEFEIVNRAGTYWYHPHPHEITGKQVYSGLAGLIVIEDDDEPAVKLPSGDHDLPIVIQDRSFDEQNQLHYSSHMMTRMRGILGDQIVINGQIGSIIPVSTRAYRFRLLNGSNSRIYKLGWDDGTTITVIGNDGGLLERPETRPYIMLAPGERADLWIDFGGRKLGSELVMRSLSFSMPSMHGGMMGGRGMMGGGRHGNMGGGRRGGMMGGRGGMMSSSKIPLGSDYAVLRFRIAREASETSRLPTRLSTISQYRLKDAVNPRRPKTITLSMRRMSALLNGRSYKMNDVTPEERIKLNSLQLIEFDNGFNGRHGMMMPHPMHIHGQQFQIVKRSINPKFKIPYQSVSAGFVDNGWKDVVLVMPGEKVTVLKRFDDFKGLFMYHCHNLEHEDMGMMRDFLVR